MKKISTKLLLLVAMMLTSMGVKAHDFKDGDLYYNILDATQLTAEVTVNLEDPYSSLTSVSIPPTATFAGKTYTVVQIGEFAFNGCSSLTSLSISEGITKIGGYAFQSCNNLNSFIIPKTLTFIAEGAFNGCTSLTSLVFHDNMFLGWSSFAGCTGLTTLTFGRHIQINGENVFANCDKVTSITCYDRQPNDFSFSESCFKGSVKATATVYVPESSLDNYRNSSWNVFANIVEIPSANLPDYDILDRNGCYEMIEIDGNNVNNVDGYLGYLDYIVAPGATPTMTIKICNFNDYVITSMAINGKDVTSALVPVGDGSYTYTFGSIDKDQYVTLQTAPKIQFNVNYDSSAGAIYDGTTLLTQGSPYYYVEGSDVTLTITPNNGYEIQGIWNSGYDIMASIIPDGKGSYTYTIKNLSYNNAGIDVSFGKLSTISSVWANCNSEMGTITDDKGNVFSPGNPIDYTKGDNVKLTFTPNPGYRLVDVMLDGMSIQASLTNDSYTISNISANANLDVIFEPLDLTLTIKDAMNGVSRLSVKGGSQMTIAFQASTGWAVGKVMFDDGTGAASTDVTAMLTPDGEFTTPTLIGNASIIVSYINTDPNHLNGDVNGDGVVDAADIVTIVKLIMGN